MVPGQLHHRELPRPVQELVLRHARGINDTGKEDAIPHMPGTCPGPSGGRQGDAQELGQRNLVRRCGRGDGRGRYQVDSLRGEARDKPAVRIQQGKGGEETVLHEAPQHLQLLLPVRLAGRVDPRSAARGAGRAGQVDSGQAGRDG